MWGSIALVSSGFALSAFIAAAIVKLYAIKTRERAELIRSASDDNRINLVRDALEFFRVDTASLTKAQQFQIALEQIRARGSRFNHTAIVICFLALLASGVSVFSLSRPSPTSTIPSRPRGPERGTASSTTVATHQVKIDPPEGAEQASSSPDNSAPSNIHSSRANDESISVNDSAVFCDRLKLIANSWHDRFSKLKGAKDPMIGDFNTKLHLPQAEWCKIDAIPVLGSKDTIVYYNCSLLKEQSNLNVAHAKFDAYAATVAKCLGKKWIQSNNKGKNEEDRAKFELDDNHPEVLLSYRINSEGAGSIYINVSPPNTF